jgi:hypothetical protein
MTTRRHFDILWRSIRRHFKVRRLLGAFRTAREPLYPPCGEMLLHFLRLEGDRGVVEETTGTPTLQQALFWMNIYRDLLAVDETALLRMRALITDGKNGKGEVYYIPDVELVVGEIERVRGRLDHWLGLVDRLS